MADFLYCMFWFIVGGAIYCFVMGCIHRCRKRRKVWYGTDTASGDDKCVIAKATEMPDGKIKIEFVERGNEIQEKAGRN